MPNTSTHQPEQLKHLMAVTPDEIEALISGGNIENLTDKFDLSLEDALKTPGLNPNELMFLDRKTKDKLALLDKEAIKAAEEAKKQVTKILEEDVPAVTMTEEDVKALTGKSKKELSPANKKKIIGDLKKQISEVLGELKKINEDENKTRKERVTLMRESSKTRNPKDKNKINTKLGQLQNHLNSLKRRKDNVMKMKSTYEKELKNI